MNSHRHNTTTRTRSAFAGCLAACLLLFVPGAETMAQAVAACEQILDKQAVDAVTRDVRIRRQVQNGLKTIYENDVEFDAERSSGWHDPEGKDFVSDGVIGRESRQWLQKFCIDYRIDDGSRLVRNVIESVVGYARIAERHPTWKAVITSVEFTDWVQTRDADEHYNVYELRRSGAAPVIIALLDEFAARPSRPGPPSPAPEPEPPESPPAACPPITATGSALYYRLSATDLEALSARKDLLAALQGFAGQHFDSDEALEAAAREAAGNAAPACIQERVLSALKDSAGESRTRHLLTQESFDALIKTNLPRPIRDALAELQGQGFATNSELLESVRVRVQAVLQSQAVTEQRERETVEAIEGVLTAIKNSNDAGDNKNGTDVPDSGSPAQTAGTEQNTKPEGGAASAKAAAETADSAQGQQSIDKLVAAVMAQAHTVNAFAVGEEPAQTLREQAEFLVLSEQALAKLGALQDIAYVNERLFSAAVGEALGLHVAAAQGQPDATVTPQQIARAVVWQARKQARGDYSVPLISAGDCGCVRGFGDKTLYGFFPFWANELTSSPIVAPTSGSADVQAPPAQGATPLEVNFNLLSRISYYALDLDQEGAIRDRRQWHGSGARQFIITAHRYRTAVDLAIRAEGWRNWSDSALKRAVDSVLLALPPQEQPRSLLQRFAGPFQDAFLSTRPDGMVLHFPHYPDSSPDQRERIVGFVDRLREKLLQQGWGESFSLSLALDLDLPGLEQRRELANLEQPREPTMLHRLLVSASEGARSRIQHLLVFMQAPIATSKRQLRAAVEGEFKKSNEQVQVLRKIVPVIAAAETAQLDDDLHYVEDNFGGIAWWPLSTADAGAGQSELEESLRTAFLKTAELDFLELQVKRLLPAICDFVCPNRVGFRIIMGLVTGVLLVALLVAFLGCGLGRLVAARPWVSVAVLVALVVVLLALLVCDPVLNSYSTDIIGGLLAVIVFSMLLRFWFRLKQGPLP